jgi:membrane protein
MKKAFLLVRRYFIGAAERRLPLYASSGAFYVFLSIIPCVLLAAAILPMSRLDRDQISEFIALVAPKTVISFLESIADQVYRRSAGVWSVSAVITLWSASKVVSSFMRGIITASGSEKSTAYVRLTLKAMGYYILIVLAMYLLVLGSVVLNVLGAFDIRPISHSRLISAVVLCLLLTLSYRFIPGKSRRYRFAFPGAVLASAAWMLFNHIYSLWLGWSDRYGVYGTVGSVIVTLLWLYASMYIIFSGAYFDLFLSRVAPRWATRRQVPAKKPPETESGSPPSE